MSNYDLDTLFNFQEVISLYLQARNMSLRQAAEQMNMNHGILGKVLRSQNTPSLVTLYKFSSLSGLSLTSTLNMAQLLNGNVNGNLYLSYKAERVDAENWYLILDAVGSQTDDRWYRTPDQYVLTVKEDNSPSTLVLSAERLPDNMFATQTLSRINGSFVLASEDGPVKLTKIEML
ncbi:hypothetical protein [Faecalibaculum rodentium]|uniref:hypothetical protein n=1 Tax=Faecalibaculum rodentium TaxID=1702221 RepID=UPI0025B0A3E0|nr:hypothetical protein [Faecalibaculum rodentium]